MKKILILMGFMLFITFLALSPSQPSLELMDASAKIVKNKMIGGSMEKTEKHLVTTISYTFTIKNTGNVKLGSFGENQGLQVKMEPNDRLVNASKEVVGMNIFNPSDYANSGLGYGHSFEPILEPGQVGKYVLHYDLGVSEKSSLFPLLAPSEERLKILEDHAFDASLIVILNGKEVTRFDLRKTKQARSSD